MFRSEKRDELARGEINFHQALKEENLQLEIDKLQYFSRWVTHAGSPRRYDTRFFIARMPEGQSAQHDGGELVDHRWLTPNEALKLSGEGKLNLITCSECNILLIEGINLKDATANKAKVSNAKFEELFLFKKIKYITTKNTTINSLNRSMLRSFPDSRILQFEHLECREELVFLASVLDI